MAQKIPSILVEICDAKQREIDAYKASGQPEIDLFRATSNPSTLSFKDAISGSRRLIAEFKVASPSKGDIRPGAEPEEIAKLYEEGGASAISVLTDPYFKGELSYLSRIRNTVEIPLLRKDFIMDPVQIYQARANGADAILLIAAILSPQQIEEYSAIARSLGMDALVESHNEAEIEKSIQGKAQIFGINNRDLNTFKTDRQTTLRLLNLIPQGFPIVTESGIETYKHVQELSHPRINAMLVGESIMSARLNPTFDDMRNRIHELLGNALNVAITSDSEAGRALSNIRESRFDFEGHEVASFEGFHQGLKYPEGSEDQKRVFGLFGIEAKKAGEPVSGVKTLTWRGETIEVGSPQHHALLKRALRARFEQNPELRRALTESGNKKIIHAPRKPDGTPFPDSKVLPAATFSQMLTELREEMR
jgi:indole-3-glycerol phosphate synthase